MKVNRIVTLFVIVCALVFSLYYNVRLENQVQERDVIIEELTQHKKKSTQEADTVIQNILSEIKFYTGGREINADEFVRYANSLQDSLSYYKAYYQVSQKYYNHSFKEIHTPSGQRKFEFVGKALDSTLIEQLQNDLIDLHVENDKKTKALKKYNIEIVDTPDKNKFRISAPTLDSALVLLPYFRHHLKLSEDKKKWIIEYPQEKKK